MSEIKLKCIDEIFNVSTNIISTMCFGTQFEETGQRVGMLS